MSIAYDFMTAVDPLSGQFTRAYLESQVVPATMALGEVVLLTSNGENFAPRYYQGFEAATREPFFSSQADGAGMIFKLTRAPVLKGADSGYLARIVEAYVSA